MKKCFDYIALIWRKGGGKREKREERKKREKKREGKRKRGEKRGGKKENNEKGKERKGDDIKGSFFLPGKGGGGARNFAMCII